MMKMMMLMNSMEIVIMAINVRINIIELLILYCYEKIYEDVTKQEDYMNQGFDSNCCMGYKD